jgi:hypothetical protein
VTYTEEELDIMADYYDEEWVKATV